MDAHPSLLQNARDAANLLQLGNGLNCGPILIVLDRRNETVYSAEMSFHPSRTMPHAVVVPGNFDGVHLGHQSLIEKARAIAKPHGWRVVALTFDPHPLAFFAHDRAPQLLSGVRTRASQIRDAGADDVIVKAFDSHFASQSPEDFVANIFLGELDAKAIVVGEDFRFGHKRAGDIALLRELGRTHNFGVHISEPVIVEGEIVSSTRIRKCLSEGNVAMATRLLGRAHSIVGTVIHGEERGRTIGFPTANLQRTEPGMVPAHGVYAVVARRRSTGELLRGVANVGNRPTFEAGFSIENHFFDFAGDLYGETLRVAFVERLRGEQKFDGVTALKEQIAKDSAAAASLLETLHRRWPAWLTP